MGETAGRTMGPATRTAAGRGARTLRWLGRALGAWAVVSAVLGGAVALYAAVIEPRRIVVERASVEVDPRPGATADRREGSLTIAFLSDLDLTRAPGAFERRIRETVNALEPDVIAVGGDLFGGKDWTPPEDTLRAMGEWLAGFRAKHGMKVVWGEQESLWPETVRAHFPGGVTDIDAGAEVVPAAAPTGNAAAGDAGPGAARFRLVGPNGMYPPMWVENGKLNAGWGRSLGVARYGGTGSAGWTGVEILGRFERSDSGDSIGIAVLEGENAPGLRLRALPNLNEWGVAWQDGAEWSGRTRDKSVYLAPRRPYMVRVRVEPAPAGTRVRSRVWPADAPEPVSETWPLDFVDTSRNRRLSGSVGIAAGGAWTMSYRPTFDAIEVRDLATGRVLLDETFDDPARFAAQWTNPGFRPQDFDATVVIAHNANFLLDMPRLSRPFDVVLAGHTHGGQVRLPLFGPLHLDPEFPRSWSAGFVRLDRANAWLYVSRGLASTHVPVRLNCPPEVTLMTVNVRTRPPR